MPTETSKIHKGNHGVNSPHRSIIYLQPHPINNKEKEFYGQINLKVNNMVILKIPQKVWNGIEFGSYTRIAQEILKNNESKRRWIAIYANYKLDFVNNKYYFFLEKTKENMFCIIDFEMDVALIEIHEGINSDEDLLNFKIYTANNTEELSHLLDNEGINQELFVPEWRCDYPL